MKKKNNGSKAENSKIVRRILSKHLVDLSNLSFSTGSSYISLSGLLLKTDGSEFTTTSVKNLVEDLNHIAFIQSDLANWELNGGLIKKNMNYFKKIEGSSHEHKKAG